MKRFAALYEELDRTSSTNAKVDAIARYLVAAPPADAAWAVHLLSGKRFQRLVPTAVLRERAVDHTGLSAWLVDDCYSAVGDLAETIALLLDAHGTRGEPDGEGEPSLSEWIETRIEPLRELDSAATGERIAEWWRELLARGATVPELLVLHKLLTGALRVGVARGLVMRAVGRIADLEPAVVQHRLMGEWRPSEDAWHALLRQESDDADHARPYPFFLASPLEHEPASLGAPDLWRAEWKWDGIRAQVVRRAGETSVWSRGEELVTERFPELAEAFGALADGTVLDGEILAWRDGRPLPFASLQRRIGRKRVGAKLLAEAPVAFMAYDLLELAGEDVRERPFDERRAHLERIVAPLAERFGRDRFDASPLVTFDDWGELVRVRERSRERSTEGLMLKRADAPYQSGRKRGAWWKWKVDPLSIDAVMVYAQAGHGRRSNLYTDYTFAVWSDGDLVPIARAYSGLTDEEISRLDRWIRTHTIERFGPVRSVPAEQVFELAFEGIQRSARHKAGLALRFPRIARWRRDKRPADADSLSSVEALLRATGG